MSFGGPFGWWRPFVGRFAAHRHGAGHRGLPEIPVFGQKGAGGSGVRTPAGRPWPGRQRRLTCGPAQPCRPAGGAGRTFKTEKICFKRRKGVNFDASFPPFACVLKGKILYFLKKRREGHLTKGRSSRILVCNDSNLQPQDDMEVYDSD